MSGEDKERLQQIRQQATVNYDDSVRGWPTVQMKSDIDFLLSLVKSQEAVSDYSELAHEIISEYNSADSPSMLRQGVAQGLARVAASMRSACVEKLREYLTDCRDEERGIIEAIAGELETFSAEKPKEQE